MELVAFVGGSLHRTLKEIEHNANRLIFPKETYIAVSDDVYILESLDSELSARKGDYQTTKPEETMTLRRNEVAGNGIQTKQESFIESLTQTAIGFLVSLFTWYCILWTELFDITVTFADNLLITGIFTVVSIVRGYLIRRFYNRRA